MDQMPADMPVPQGEPMPRRLLDALGRVVDDHLPGWAELDEEAQDRRAEWSAAGVDASDHAQWALRAQVTTTAERAVRRALHTAEALAPATRELVLRGVLADGRSPLHVHLAQVVRGLKAAHSHALALCEPGTPAARFHVELQGLCHGVLRVNGGLMQLESLLQ